MLTAKDIAARWNVSVVTVYKLFNDGLLPGLRLSPKNIRFREQDILEYEKSHWNTTPSTNSYDTEESTPYTEPEMDDPTVNLLVQKMQEVLNESSSTPGNENAFGSVPVITL